MSSSTTSQAVILHHNALLQQRRATAPLSPGTTATTERRDDVPKDLQRRARLAGVGVVKSSLDCIGITTDKVFSHLAEILGENIGKAAHRLGYGPQAVADRILRHLRKERREKVLTDCYNSSNPIELFIGLEKDCFALLEYSLPYDLS
jgi:hypothetical protein